MNDAFCGALKEPKPTISIHMPSSRNGRRFAVVSTLLSELKIEHNAVFPWLRRLKLKGLEARAAKSGYCTLTSQIAKHSDILITDQPVKNWDGKTIRISYAFMDHLKTEAKQNALFLPILFHPSLLSKSSYAKADLLAQNVERSIGMLFAGNCDRKTYDNDRIQKQYGLANRHQLFEYVKSLPADLVFIPSAKSDFDEALKSGDLKNKFVWIDTEVFKIPQTEWFDLLATARYFFCTPGVHYPYCQNLNEAAACGAVPVLQYPDFYLPNLENGVNCLAFKSTSDLISVISKAIRSTEQDQWVAQSRSTIQWHQQHMSLDHAENELIKFIKDPSSKHLTWVLAGK